MKSKYSILSRSQVMIRITQLENVLLHTRMGSENARRAAAERQELFQVLREKDAALIKKFWESHDGSQRT